MGITTSKSASGENIRKSITPQLRVSPKTAKKFCLSRILARIPRWI
jgi:hypothetical protein